MNLGIISLLPITVCLVLILLTKNAFISILSGLFTASIIIYFETGAIFTTVNSVIGIATDPYQFKIIGFVALTGALVGAMQQSGGIDGVVNLLQKRKRSTSSKIAGQLFTMLIGILMFMDGTSSMAVTAVVGKPIFKESKLSKEKLALIVNSTAAPIAWIIPFGGAGAMIAGALNGAGVDETVSFGYVLEAVGFQFYTIILLVVLFLSIVFNKEIGPIKNINYEDHILSDIAVNDKKAINMILPILVLIISIISMILYTGEGNILYGDGATAVFTSGFITLVFTVIFYRLQNLADFNAIMSWVFGGMKNMVEICVLLLIAFAFGKIIGEIGTASYLVQLTKFIPTSILPLAILALCSLIAFATGTSSGTVAIMIPLVIPVIISTGGNIALAVGAVVSGAVFGDQNSVISDSVIMTSSMTDVEPITHVKTQMPYTLISLGISAILYLILGFVL